MLFGGAGRTNNEKQISSSAQHLFAKNRQLESAWRRSLRLDAGLTDL
jgi:hypothetical protein